MLLFPQLLKKFPGVYGTHKFIAIFTTACNLPLSWAREIHSMPSHLIFQNASQYYMRLHAYCHLSTRSKSTHLFIYAHVRTLSIGQFLHLRSVVWLVSNQLTVGFHFRHSPGICLQGLRNPTKAGPLNTCTKQECWPIDRDVELHAVETNTKVVFNFKTSEGRDICFVVAVSRNMLWWIVTCQLRHHVTLFMKLSHLQSADCW